MRSFAQNRMEMGNNRSRRMVRRGYIGLFLLFSIIVVEFSPFFLPSAQAKVSVSSLVSSVDSSCDHVTFSSDGNPFPLCPGGGAKIGGNCVWWAWEQWHLLGYDLPLNWGNANDWIVDAEAAGYSVGTTPRVGAIVVFPVDDGVWAGADGHVAFVTSVSSDATKFDVTYQNYGDAQYMYVGTNFDLSLINQSRYQNGQVRFIYFPRAINVSAFLQLPGITASSTNTTSSVQQANTASQTNDQSTNNSTVISSNAAGSDVTQQKTFTNSRVALGFAPSSSDQEFRADFTGGGTSDLLLYNRQGGDLSVMSFSSTQKAGSDAVLSSAVKTVHLGDAMTPVGQWGSSLEIYIGNFAGGKASDILLYDSSAGTFQFLSLGADLQIQKHVTINDIGTDWEISVGSFDGQKSGLFMYKRFAYTDPYAAAIAADSDQNASITTTSSSSAVVSGLDPSPVVYPAPTLVSAATTTTVPSSTKTTTTTSAVKKTTPTPDVKATATPTVKSTPQATATSQATVVATETPSPTPTQTPVAVATATPTVTPTIEASPTVTATPSVTPTVVATETPSPTATVTTTPTATETSTPSVTDSVTPVTATPTSTPTPIATTTGVDALAAINSQNLVSAQDFLAAVDASPITASSVAAYTSDHELSGDQLQTWEVEGRTANVLVMDFDKNFAIQHMQQYTLWHSSWEVYVGRFANANQDGVFLYDRLSGEGRMMDFSNDLSINDYQEIHNLDKNWIVSTGDFAGSGRAQLLFYNPQSGALQLLAFDKHLALQNQMMLATQDTHDTLYTGHFGLFTEGIMLYNAQAAQSTFISFTSSLQIDHQYIANSWDQNWQILLGDFVSPTTSCTQSKKNCTQNDDILVLNRQTGVLEQYEFAFGRQYSLFDNRIQSFQREGMQVQNQISLVDSSSFSLLSSINTGIQNEELY